MKCARLAALFSVICSQAGAATIDGCLPLKNDLERLACYDNVSGFAPSTSVTPSESKWVVSTETSKMTDDKNITLVVRSNEAVDCGWNRNSPIDLLVRCSEKTTAIIFGTGCHMTSSDYNNYGDIEYRIDQEKARTVNAVESTNNKSLGLWNGKKSIPFIKQMMGKKQMVVRMTPYGQNPFTATFDIAGLDGLIDPLRKECGW